MISAIFARSGAPPVAGGEALANRAAALDVTLGKGHIVTFALRPFWRWQTQGTCFLAFNAILNWDHPGRRQIRAPITGAGLREPIAPQTRWPWSLRGPCYRPL